MKNKLKHLVPVLLALATITGSLSSCELKPKAQQKVSKQGFYFDTIIQITALPTRNT
jgi:thiamine biosynthesis lipoprotein